MAFSKSLLVDSKFVSLWIDDEVRSVEL